MHSHRPGPGLLPEAPEIVGRRFRNMGLLSGRWIWWSMWSIDAAGLRCKSHEAGYSHHTTTVDAHSRINSLRSKWGLTQPGGGMGTWCLEQRLINGELKALRQNPLTTGRGGFTKFTKTPGPINLLVGWVSFSHGRETTNFAPENEFGAESRGDSMTLGVCKRETTREPVL